MHEEAGLNAQPLFLVHITGYLISLIEASFGELYPERLN
jgi:hypothetical protein